jgi:hypothetical protein
VLEPRRRAFTRDCLQRFVMASFERPVNFNPSRLTSSFEGASNSDIRKLIPNRLLGEAWTHHEHDSMRCRDGGAAILLSSGQRGDQFLIQVPSSILEPMAPERPPRPSVRRTTDSPPLSHASFRPGRWSASPLPRATAVNRSNTAKDVCGTSYVAFKKSGPRRSDPSSIRVGSVLET